MRLTVKNMAVDKTAEITAISKETLEISPNNDSNNSGWGTIKNPAAKDETKITPTRASVGKEVFISSSQIKKIPRSKKIKAPKETSKPNSKASPMPGKATWPRASPTKAILLVSINDPK